MAAPLKTSVVGHGPTLTITFDQALDPANLPTADSFSVTNENLAQLALSAITIVGASVRMTVSPATGFNIGTWTLEYVPTAFGGDLPLQNIGGEDVLGFTAAINTIRGIRSAVVWTRARLSAVTATRPQLSTTIKVNNTSL